jgi:ComF family protein
MRCQVWQMLQGLGGRLIDLILPRFCDSCQQLLPPGGAVGFCEACWAMVRLITPPYCPRCGQPFRSPVALTHSPDFHCGTCRRRPPPFDHARAIAYYEGPLRQAIHLLKYRGKLSLQRRLLQLAIAHFEVHFPGVSFDIIIPIPLHQRRLMQREFNQAALMARGIAHHLTVPMREQVLVRTRWTRPQVELSGDERRANVRQAFTIKDPAAIQDRVVLLVDDVFTTGATLREAARTLKAAGARQVDVFALARVIRD